jgi:geranylgeranyl pyrophosphate synthase
LRNLFADPKTVLALAIAVLAGIGILFYAFFRPSADPEEAERKRRLHLNQIGRIAEGQVVELTQHPAEEEPAPKVLFGSKPRPPTGRLRHIVSYSYSISGVIYQTGQDITGLESQVRLERLVAGQPASIKYDPSNPIDSILVADDWSGLR